MQVTGEGDGATCHSSREARLLARGVGARSAPPHEGIVRNRPTGRRTDVVVGDRQPRDSFRLPSASIATRHTSTTTTPAPRRPRRFSAPAPRPPLPTLALLPCLLCQQRQQRPRAPPGTTRAIACARRPAPPFPLPRAARSAHLSTEVRRPFPVLLLLCCPHYFPFPPLVWCLFCSIATTRPQSYEFIHASSEL